MRPESACSQQLPLMGAPATASTRLGIGPRADISTTPCLRTKARARVVCIVYLHAIGGGGHPFDADGPYARLHDRRQSEAIELLGGVAREQFLAAPPLTDSLDVGELIRAEGIILVAQAPVVSRQETAS